MASTRVTLRTAFPGDVFQFGDWEIDSEGVELPSRKQADEVLESARRNGVNLYEVPQDAAPATEGKSDA